MHRHLNVKFPSTFLCSKIPEQSGIHVFRAVLHQVHSRPKSEFTECDVVVPLSPPSMISFPWVIQKLLTSSNPPSPFPSRDDITEGISLAEFNTKGILSK